MVLPCSSPALQLPSTNTSLSSWTLSSLPLVALREVSTNGNYFSPDDALVIAQWFVDFTNPPFPALAIVSHLEVRIEDPHAILN